MSNIAGMQASTNARTIFPNPPRSHTVDDVLNANRVNAAAREAESAEQGIVQQQHAVSDLSTPRTPGVNLTGDSTTAQRRRGATQHRRSIPGRALVRHCPYAVQCRLGAGACVFLRKL